MLPKRVRNASRFNLGNFEIFINTLKLLVLERLFRNVRAVDNNTD